MDKSIAILSDFMDTCQVVLMHVAVGRYVPDENTHGRTTLATTDILPVVTEGLLEIGKHAHQIRILKTVTTVPNVTGVKCIRRHK